MKYKSIIYIGTTEITSNFEETSDSLAIMDVKERLKDLEYNRALLQRLEGETVIPIWSKTSE